MNNSGQTSSTLKDSPLEGSFILNCSTVIDVARIVGASMIFYFHVGLMKDLPFSRWGEYAVTLFILLIPISAYLLSRKGIPKISLSLDYSARRIAEIYPVFAVISIAIFLGSFFISSPLGRPYTLWELFANLSLISQYIGTRYMSYTMWFMPFVVQIFLLLPLLFFLRSRLGSFAFLSLSLLIACSSTALIYFLLPAPFATIVCREWSPLFRLGEVAAGVVLAHSSNARKFTLNLLLCFPVAIAGAIPAFFLPQATYIYTYFLYGLVISCLVILLVAPAAMLATMFFKFNFRLWAKASYPFFLGHGVALRSIGNHGEYAPVLLSIYFAFCWIGSLALVSLESFLRRHFSRRAQILPGNAHEMGKQKNH